MRKRLGQYALVIFTMLSCLGVMLLTPYAMAELQRLEIHMPELQTFWWWVCLVLFIIFFISLVVMIGTDLAKLRTNEDAAVIAPDPYDTSNPP